MPTAGAGYYYVVEKKNDGWEVKTCYMLLIS